MGGTATLADRAAGLLGSRFGRRGFLARTAVVGSALAANPLTYALKPTSAYAAICSCNGSSCECGSLCCDGYTEFCCTLTGQNTCPPGTLMGGWWKVDGSGFCGGPRYYMDCNAPCNGCGCGSNGICGGECSGTGCGCANGSCDNRKAGCTMFRYGQCNQHLACIGPIVCRVVTCVPPWSIDATCTTTVRVDQNTAGHDRACLHQVTGGIDAMEEVGRSVRVRGWALDFDTADPVRVHVYVAGQLAADVMADQPRPGTGAAFPGWGDAHGFEVVLPIEPGGAKEVCAYGLNAGYGSVHTLLGCRQVDPRGPFGRVEAVAAEGNAIRVRGWAIDPDTSGPVQVHVYVDGQGFATATADLPRPDVGSSHPGYGPDHGFDVFVPGITSGRHEICVWAINIGAGTGNTMLGCLPVVVGGIGFSDVPPGHPFYDEIAWLAGTGIASGYPDGTFQPTAAVSRQAMAAFLRRLDERLGGPAVGAGPSFSDVPAGHPFRAEIAWLAASGIASGYPDGTFQPTAAVSRQAMAAFLRRLDERLGGPAVGAGPSFSDVPVDHPFRAEIAWLAASGVASGYADGTFKPTASVSRQAMAAFLYRLVQRL